MYVSIRTSDIGLKVMFADTPGRPDASVQRPRFQRTQRGTVTATVQLGRRVVQQILAANETAHAPKIYS